MPGLSGLCALCYVVSEELNRDTGRLSGFPLVEVTNVGISRRRDLAVTSISRVKIRQVSVKSYLNSNTQKIQLENVDMNINNVVRTSILTLLHNSGSPIQDVLFQERAKYQSGQTGHLVP